MIRFKTISYKVISFIVTWMIMISGIIPTFSVVINAESIVTETPSQKIENFRVSFVSGADNIGTDDNPDYVWVATRHDAEHRFVYQMDYDLSGEGFLAPNTIQFVIPKYIIKDRNNNWANNYELAVPIDSEVSEGDNENIFVYKEDGNNIVVYNRLQVSAAEKGSIQFAYDTNKSMLDYVDMKPSEILYAEFNIDKNVNEHLHTVDDITRVKIDTTATIGSSSQYYTVYEKWRNNWGNASDFGIDNPDDYYYLYWVIKTKVSFVTQPYTFRLNSDTVTGSNGNADFVAVRMGDSGKFSSSFIDSNVYRMVDVNREINQYVITKHLKSTYMNLEKYYIKNSSVISLHPIDNIDSNTEAISSCTYNMKKNEHIYPTAYLYFMKRGYTGYTGYNTLSLTNQPANYELSEFTDNNIGDIHNNMSYDINMSASAYLFTIQDGYKKEDTEYYGCKDIKYSITDEDFYLNDSITEDNILNNELPNDLRKLEYDDFEITSFNYSTKVSSATWTDYRFVARTALPSDFEDNDALDFYAKFGNSDNWVKIGSRNMKTSVITKDNNYVKYFSSDTVEFKDGVSCVGIKVETSNKLYSTSINIKPQYKLKKSDYVKNIANMAVNSGDPKIWITNKANCKMSVGGTELFNSDKYARNIIVGYIKVSDINKTSSFVNINKVKKLVNVGWTASVSESYNTQSGICYVKQESGKFYDLLPVGSDVDKSTITVKADEELKQSDYDVQTITNYKGTGRTLLIINIKAATETKYSISYSTVHSMESLYDYGITVRNTLAYETGNNVIANGFADNGGNIKDADIMNDLDSSTDDCRFIYTDSSRILNLLFAVSSGLTKMVKASGDTHFSRNTTVHQSHYYTYRLRYANDFLTKAKNIVFYDNIENYFGSKWQGELQSIDVSQAIEKGAKPAIYLSEQYIDIDDVSNRNLNSSVWIPMDEFNDISKAKSIAVDISKKDDGSDFVLNQNESVVVLVNMLSPDSDPGESLSLDEIPAKALNSIYLDSDMMNVFTGQTYNHNLIHWNNDTVEYKTMGDVLILKVDARDNTTPVKGISFSLMGVSDYGTVVSEEKESDINGLIDFRGIEKGSYTLTETSGSKDYQKNNETINVVINADGSISYNGDKLSKNARYIIADEPRIHTDIRFTKRDNTNKNRRIAGVKFHLYGTSEYNNFVSKTAISDNYGNVVFEDIELGHYELEELTVADGYIEDNSIYKVFINEQGTYSIDGSIMEKDGTLSIYNEPYHSFTIQKESFTEMAGIAMPVEGAVFILVGNSDRGTSVNMMRTSGANGKLTFSGIESGSYILREVEAPEGYAIDDVDHMVKIAKDGKVTISGLDKNSYGEFIVKDKEDSTVTVTKKWVDNETNETRTVEPKIHLGVKESVPVAYFGSNVSSNNTSSYGNSVLNLLTPSSNIKAFKPFKGTKSEAISAFRSNTSRRIDDGSTDYEIYAWIISDSSKPDYGTVYWWSDAKFVYLTDKSHELFSKLSSVKTIDVSGIDISKVTDMSNMFCNDSSLTDVIGLDNWGVSNVTNMSNMFSNCSKLTSIQELENWDVSNVTNMQYMFNYCSQLTSLQGLENWDVSNVTDMKYMFYNCTQLTSLQGLENWDTSNVTNMSYMFYNCRQLTSIEPLENWDISNVTDMKYMLYYCTQLTSLQGLENWDTSNVTNMSYMFYNCRQLTSIEPLENWDVSNVTDMQYMFYGCSQLSSADLHNWDVSNVRITVYMFGYCNKLVDVNINNWNCAEISNMTSMFSECAKLEYIHSDNWTASKLSHISNIFYKCSALKEVDVSGWDVKEVTSLRSLFVDCSQLQDLDLTNWDVSNVTDMYKMFYNCSKLTSIQGLENWDVSNVTDMAYMFYNCRQLTSIKPLENWGTSNVTNMASMFYSCSKLTSIQGLENWDVSNVTNMASMFYACSKLTSIQGLESWDVSNVTNMASMFYNCGKLTSLEPLENWDVSNVTDMRYMFFYCSQLTSLQGLDNWGVSNVTDMTSMFSNCSQLTSLQGLENWDVSNVTNMTSMFSNCSQLTSLQGLEDWDVSNVTDMQNMFYNCGKLTSLEPLENWDVSNVTNIHMMFYNCTQLTSLQGLENWDVSNVTNMSNMFKSCSQLTSLQGLENWDVSNVTNMSDMFSYCSKIEFIDLSNWNTVSLTNIDGMFYSCSELACIDLSNWNTNKLSSLSKTFYWCQNLVKIYATSFWDRVDSIATSNKKQTFYQCISLNNDGVSMEYNESKISGDYAKIGSDSVEGYFRMGTEHDVVTSTQSDNTHLHQLSTGKAYFKTSLYTSGYGYEQTYVKNWGGMSPNNIDNVKYFRKFTGDLSILEDLIANNKANIVSEDGSGIYKIYGWFVSDTSAEDYGTVYWWSNAATVALKDSAWGLFSGLNNLIEADTEDIDVSEVNDFSYTFYNCSRITTLNLRNWVTNSSVFSTSKMFYGCTALESIQGLEDFNMQNVSNTDSMFYSCSKLTSIQGLENWDVSNVTNMASMFYSCSKLTSIQGLESWDVSNVANMSDMFSYCKQLTSIEPLENWDVSNVTDMRFMFYNCSKLTSIQGLEDWDVSNVTSMYCMFYYCSQLASLQGLENWDVSNVTGMRNMFNYCSQLTSLQGLENWDVSNVTDMAYMFYNCRQLTSIKPLENWGTSNVTNMSYMFRDCSQLTSLQGLESWDVSNVTDMQYMFYNCWKLTSLEPLENWDVSNVTNMASMFYSCSKLTSIQGLENWDVSNVKNISGMFTCCSRLVDASELRNWNTYSVTSMDNMFYGCSNLEDLSSIKDWDVSNVTGINRMFYECSKLISLDLSRWEFNSLENMDYAFYHCCDLRELDVSNWDTSNIRSMSHMFYSCNNLIQVKGLESWNTINVTDMGYMFSGCSKLTDFNISNWIVDNIVGGNNGGFVSTFSDCYSIKSIDLSGWSTINLVNANNMFGYCVNLETIYVSDSWNIDSCQSSNNMFIGCQKLVGEKGTKYSQTSNSEIDKTRAHIDRLDNPGYLTYKSSTPKNILEVYDSTDERCKIEKVTDDNWYYTFTELDPSLEYYTWEDEMENYTSVNMTKNRAVRVVDGTATITNKTTVNTPTFGSLKISKNILNNDGTDTITSDDASKQFLFVISFVDGEDNISSDRIYDAVLLHNGVENATKLAMIDGKLQLLLSDNDIVMIRDIPTGYKYTITEALDDKFTMSVGSGALTGTITENNVSTTDIINTKVLEEVEEFVTFKLKKVVVGNYIDASEKFKFSLNFTGLKPNEVYNIVSNKQSDISYKANKNGVGFAEVELIDGEELTITVPKDSVYVISESGGNYISSYKIIDNAGLNLITKSHDNNFEKNQELSIQSETADLNEDIEITFTNKKIETQRLTLQKELINVSSSNNDIFDFIVKITDLEDGAQISSSLGTLIAEDSNEIVVQFPLAVNTPVEFYNIPVNAKYKITEVASDYISSYKIYDKEHNELESGANTEVNKALETGTRTVTKDVDTSVVYTNRKVSCDITIRKEIDMTYSILTENKYRYTPFTFDISLTGLTKPLNQIDVQYIDDSITGVVTKKLSQVLGITDESANEIRSNVNLTVELFNGQAIKIKDMPKNATCSVTERASDSYIASYKVRGNADAVIQAHDTANDVKNMELSMDMAEVVDNEDTDIVITFTNQYVFQPYVLPAAGMSNNWYVLYGVAFIMLILTLAYTYSSYKRRQEV